MATILLVDDHKPSLEFLSRNLVSKGYQVYTALDLESTLHEAAQVTIDVALVDLMFEGLPVGLDILSGIKGQNKDTAVIMMTAHATIPTAVEAMRRGAYTYLEKKSLRDLTPLLNAIEEGLQWRQFSLANRSVVDSLSFTSSEQAWLASPIRQEVFVQHFRCLLEEVENARSTDSNDRKKKSLEDLASFIVEAVPGLQVYDRDVRTSAEEIDILVRNESSNLFWRDKVGNPFIIECKNWKTSIGVQQIRSFHDVLREKGIRTGFLASILGVTGDAHRDAMSYIRSYVRDMNNIVVPLDKQHLARIAQGDYPTIVLSDAFYALYRI